MISTTRLQLYARLFRRLLANPRYFYFTLRGNAHARTAARLARGDLPANGTFYPVKLDLRLVYACNLRCKMCAQWGDTGTYFDYDTPKLQRKLDLQVIDSVVRELVPHGLRYVDMEGGETFLYPDIIELLRRLKAQGLFVKPITNGTLLAKFAHDIVDSGVDAVNISVDGDREAHNFVRQAEWAYDKTMEGLSALVEARARAGKQTPLIKISFTMTRHNKAASLRKLCEELAGKGLIDVLVVKSTPIWVPEEAGQAYNALIEKHFPTAPNSSKHVLSSAEGPVLSSAEGPVLSAVDGGGIQSWRGFLDDYSDFGEAAKEIAETLRDLEAQDYDFFVDRVPSIPLEELPRVYTDYQWNLGRSHCAIAYVEPTIDSDGNVYPCNLFTDEPLAMGNVNQTPFLDIWFGERFQEFRRMLASQGGLLPICTRCCQLAEA